MLLGAIEGGGTKFRCALATQPGRIVEHVAIPTTTPDETLEHVARFFRISTGGRRLTALGIASFGPVDLRRGSSRYGFITTTPKPGWNDVDIVGRLAATVSTDALAFDTDVNAAAVAEHRWGAGEGIANLAYITIGTGIGAGFLVEGHPLHGLIHPEFGHIRVPHDRTVDAFAGACPLHGNCLEGLASGRALDERWQTKGESLPDDHPAWPLETHYLALGLANLICTLSPERIILGGGVAQRLNWTSLRAAIAAQLAGYLRARELSDAIHEYVVPPMLGDDSGLIGALAMAHDLIEQPQRDAVTAATTLGPR